MPVAAPADGLGHCTTRDTPVSDGSTSAPVTAGAWCLGVGPSLAPKPPFGPLAQLRRCSHRGLATELLQHSRQAQVVQTLQSAAVLLPRVPAYRQLLTA
eukprot:5771324-Prymnesium_polylepis.3